MKAMLLIPLLATIASTNAGLLHGGLFTPTTNIVSSRTIVGGAVGGGPTSGAISTSQYSQTVAAPATVHTIITSYPAPNLLGYSGAGTDAGTNAALSTSGSGGNAVGALSHYGYNNGQVASSSAPGGGGSGQGGYGRQGGNHGGGQSSAYAQSQPSYYNQRY